jgi:hypothetical protein
MVINYNIKKIDSCFGKPNRFKSGKGRAIALKYMMKKCLKPGDFIYKIPALQGDFSAGNRIYPGSDESLFTRRIAFKSNYSLTQVIRTFATPCQFGDY